MALSEDSRGGTCRFLILAAPVGRTARVRRSSPLPRHPAPYLRAGMAWLDTACMRAAANSGRPAEETTGPIATRVPASAEPDMA